MFVKNIVHINIVRFKHAYSFFAQYMFFHGTYHDIIICSGLQEDSICDAFVTCFPVFASACRTDVCVTILDNIVPNTNFALGPWLITDVEFLHQPIS